MLRTKDILDEKDKRLHMVSEEVNFPLSKEDIKNIDLMEEYLVNSQIEEIAEKKILELYSKNLGILRADILKVGHHGSKTSSSLDFINAINGEYAAYLRRRQQKV